MPPPRPPRRAQSRRCIRDPALKYLVGDALAAACGAPIAIEAVDHTTGTALAAADLPGIALRVAVVNAKRVEEGGSIESSVVAKHASKPLLVAHKHAATEETSHDDEGRVVVPLGTPLSSLAVAASSEAVLGGHRPQFQILVAPIDAASGAPLPETPPLLTAGFVVATPRVRSAVKRDIPHLSDPISKLKAVGKATQARLRDLTAALGEAGSGPPLEPPLSSVLTVGDFKRLVEWASNDPERTERVKKGLKITKGWEEAVAHAATAVGSDTRLRVWLGSSDAALVFGADQGLPNHSEGPLGVLKLSALEAAPGAASAVYVCDPRRGGALPWGGPVPEAITAEALDAWHRPGHPGWGLLPTETAVLKSHAALHPTEPLLVPAYQETPPAPVVGRVMQPGAALPTYVPPPPAAPAPAGGDDALAFSLAVAAVQAMQIPNNMLESLLEGLQAQEEAGAAAAAAAAAAAPEATPLPPPTADALLRASGTLLRTITPEWAKMASLNTQEWQQLLQQATEEASGDVGGSLSPEPFPPPAKRHRDA